MLNENRLILHRKLKIHLNIISQIPSPDTKDVRQSHKLNSVTVADSELPPLNPTSIPPIPSSTSSLGALTGKMPTTTPAANTTSPSVMASSAGLMTSSSAVVSSVIKVQSLVRGFRARIRYWNLVDQREAEMYREYREMGGAALLIQRVWRGFSVR